MSLYRIRLADNSFMFEIPEEGIIFETEKKSKASWEAHLATQRGEGGEVEEYRLSKIEIIDRLDIESRNPHILLEELHWYAKSLLAEREEGVELSDADIVSIYERHSFNREACRWASRATGQRRSIGNWEYAPESWQRGRNTVGESLYRRAVTLSLDSKYVPEQFRHITLIQYQTCELKFHRYKRGQTPLTITAANFDGDPACFQDRGWLVLEDAQ